MSTGGSQSLGGISADVTLETGNLDAQLARVQGALDKAAAGIKRWQAEFAAGKISAQQLDSAIGPLIAHQDELRASYDRLTQAQAAMATSTTQVGAAMTGIATQAGRTSAASRNMGMSLMQVGYIVDDLQYSFSAAINNIAPLIAGFTGSMGLAAAAQVVGVGVYQLIRHWDDLTALFGEGHVESEAEEMEKLAQATKRTADEEERLGKYRKERADIQRMLEGESTEQKATEAAVQDVYNEADPKKVKAFLASQLRQQREALGLTAGEQEEIRKAGEGAVAGAGGGELGEAMPSDAELAMRRGLAEQAKRKEIADRIRQGANAAAEKLMLAARQEGPRGDAAAAQIEGFVRNPQGPIGVPNGLGGVGAARPGERKAQEALEVQGRLQAEGIAERAKEKEAEQRLAEEQADDSIRMQREGRRRQQENRRKNLEQGREAAPGIDEMAIGLAREARTNGIPLSEVQGELAAYLQSKGRTEHQATAAAEDITKEAGKKAETEAVQEALKPSRKTQVFDASELANRIQTSVGGGDETKKIRELVQRAVTKWEAEQGNDVVTLKVKK